MAPKFQDTSIVVLKQGRTVQAAFDAVNGMIDSTIKKRYFSAANWLYREK